MSRRLRKLLGAVGYLLAVALLVEGILRVGLPAEKLDLMIMRNSQDGHELYWRSLWLRRSRETDIYYRFDAFHPRLGWLSKPNLRREPVFDGRWLSTNAQGLRAERDFTIARPAGVSRRIALLGDSFTFGDEVSNDETFAHLLQEHLGPGDEVMNFGVHGYGHDQMLVMWRELVRGYRPDLVLLGYVSFDVSRNGLPFRDYSKPYFVQHGDGLALRYAWHFMPPERLRRILPLEPRLWHVAQALYRSAWANRGVEQRNREQREQRELTARILSTLRDEVEAEGGKFAMFYLPTGRQVTLEGPPPGRTSFEKFFGRLCKQERIACMSARPAFAAGLRAGIQYKSTGHWQTHGHRTVAGYLATALGGAAPTR